MTTEANDDRARPHVFVSHNSADKPQVIRLARALEAHGVRVWLDMWEIDPGQQWEAKLNAALSEASVVLACVGEHGKGPWHDHELDYARTHDKAMRLVRLPGWVDAKLGLEHLHADDLREAWDRAVELLAAYLEPLATLDEPPAAPSWHQGAQPIPYPNLSSFGAADARWFFGREQETSQTLHRLMKQRWMWLVGNSGSGKSSLAKAGVTAWWCTAADKLGHAVVIKPGNAPAIEFAARLAAMLEGAGIAASPEKIREVEQDPSRARSWMAQAMGSDEHRRWLVVVDQAEELLAAGPSSTAASDGVRVLEALASLAQDQNRRFHVLLTLRDGFRHRAAPQGAQRVGRCDGVEPRRRGRGRGDQGAGRHRGRGLDADLGLGHGV
ncbi:MAG: toll/interleukin-1 receptor domain-containing protein [Deltaproteobacteria bacterium]|nr:toll/interleukin-1 receptor domain-containing protein [Deltaproteobacteria bacterium]